VAGAAGAKILWKLGFLAVIAKGWKGIFLAILAFFAFFGKKIKKFLGYGSEDDHKEEPEADSVHEEELEE